MDTVPAKTILSGYMKDNPWFGLEYNMNLYRGCCHGCIYCDSRSSCYGIEDFARVRVKENALETLWKELSARRKKGVIATGSMSDPYNPYEKALGYTAKALEYVDIKGFGIGIATKGTLITRDIPVLQSIGRHSPVLCKVTITACDDALSRIIEPGAPLSSERFAAVSALSEAGVYAGLLLMPLLPDITDNRQNIIGIVKMAAEAGARFIYPAWGMTIRDGQREYFYEQLDAHFPGLSKIYQKRYGMKYHCASPHARAISQAFIKECRKYGILYRMQDIIADYKKGYEQTQLSLFE